MSVVGERLWMLLDDGSINVLSTSGSLIENVEISPSVETQGRQRCVCTAVTTACSGDVIVAFSAVVGGVSGQGLGVMRPTSRFLEQVFSGEAHLDVVSSSTALYALRKRDRNVSEYFLVSDRWVSLRTIELVPTTQYTRLTASDDFLYASSVLPDVIHRVDLDTCRVKTLGFRGSGCAGELRSPRVSGATSQGVLVSDYWNNRLQVLDVNGAFHILDVTSGVAGPQDALLDRKTGHLFVLSYVEKSLYSLKKAY